MAAGIFPLERAKDTVLDYDDAQCVEAHLLGLEYLGMKGALDYAYEHKPRPVKARCYMEFCCYVATVDVVLVDRSNPEILRMLGEKSKGPIPWGWCEQHAHNSH